MIIQYYVGSTEESIAGVRRFLRARGFRVTANPGQQRAVPEEEIVVDNVFGKVNDGDRQQVRGFACVKQVIPIEGVPQNLSLVRRGRRYQLQLPKPGGGRLPIGGGAQLTVMAGVCAVDARHTLTSHQLCQRAGADMNRGGAFKPRTSPYDFQGLKEDGLRILCEARAQVGLPVVSEILDVRDLDLFMRYDVDMLQIGTRNAQNFELLIEVGKSGKPVLYKRGFSNTMEESLKAANYVMEQNNENLAFCLRGVKGIGHSYRNQSDLDEIVWLAQHTDRPIIYDASHSCGTRAAVARVGAMAAAGGADGILLDVHSHPAEALVDGFQAVSDEAQLAQMIAKWRLLHQTAAAL